MNEMRNAQAFTNKKFFNGFKMREKVVQTVVL